MITLRPHQQKALESMSQNSKGILVMPTGAGKTNVAIFDAIEQLKKSETQTIVVVSPKILLSEQLSCEFLEFITNTSVFHCHSGQTRHKSSTNLFVIQQWMKQNANQHRLIFTTYHSLHRLIEADVFIDTIYFDESHHTVKRNFFPSVKHYSSNAKRCYFLTATPKTSNVTGKPGMNDVEIYGKIICHVSAPELVSGGYIVPPKLQTHSSKTTEECDGCVYSRDYQNLVSIITENQLNKILVVSKKTKDMIGLIYKTDFMKFMNENQYEILHISSQWGAYVNEKKVSREVFFNTLRSYGNDVNKKFVILNHSILGEGMNCSSLNAVVFQRGVDATGILQNVGRTLRLDSRDVAGFQNGTVIPGKLETYHKPHGLVVTPVFDRVTRANSKKIESCLTTVFVEGKIAETVIQK